ncbi:MAG: hypothetical protein FWD60_03755 [Candidatus Azobacteroides sp.]|nr:hypothetical protein [Candidatus Azobacteroides sp.]
MKTIMIMKNILKRAIVLIGFYCLSILPASANVSNPEEGWNSPPADVNTVSSTSEKTVLEQTHAELKPFEDAEVPQTQLLRAGPGGGGNAQKESVPVCEGIWIIVGLAIAYGVVCRKSTKKETP